jgi:hypothetical protein
MSAKVDVLAAMAAACGCGPSIHTTDQDTGETYFTGLANARDAVAALLVAATQAHAWIAESGHYPITEMQLRDALAACGVSA